MSSPINVPPCFFSLLLNLELTSLARSKSLLLLRPQLGDTSMQSHTLGTQTHVPMITEQPLCQLNRLPSPQLKGVPCSAYKSENKLEKLLLLPLC